MFSHLQYIRRSKHMRSQARETLGYIGSRPGKNNETIERALFGKGGRLTPEQVEDMIAAAPDNTLFWRLILNPDPREENPEKLLDLRELTRDAVSWLERRLGKNGIPRPLPFVAAVHDDHTALAHVHGIIFMARQGREKPITPHIVREFNAYVATLARSQKQARELGKETLIQLSPDVHAQEQSTALSSSGSGGGGGFAEGEFSLGVPSTSCPSCLVGTLTKRRNSEVYECSRCGYAVRRGVVIRWGRRKEREYARSF